MTEKNLKFFVLIFLLLYSLFVQAKFVWINFSQNSVAAFFYDPGSLKKKNHHRTVWIMANYKNPTRSGELSVTVKQTFDCKRARYKILRLNSYPQKNGKGPVLTSYPTQKNWKIIIAGTPDSDLMKIMCTK
ncbi:MAG: hypothetical protein CBD16_08030 [Betaproteobacteria bacterium TMED156]|nr:MAG: hypothetical protein CBD16_08030 [Betaproteobacteria bacterium TMED156]|tara:strand:- start:905 stop:1297 length:393 start_codon:yes stop_codon:yes gene_type:complete